MIADSDESHPRDSRILPNYSMEDIDKETLIQYRQLFANLKPSHPWLNLNDIEFLTKLEAYRKDRSTKVEGFTLAAVSYTHLPFFAIAASLACCNSSSKRFLATPDL